MTTIFMTSLSELTDTAYAKWIDVWLIFSQLVPFTEVILLTLKEAFRGEEKNEGKKKRRRRRKKTTHRTSNQSLVINVVQPYEGESGMPSVQEATSEVSGEKVQKVTKETPKMVRGKLFYVKIIGKTQKLYWLASLVTDSTHVQLNSTLLKNTSHYQLKTLHRCNF